MMEDQPKIILTYKKIEPVVNKFVKFAIPLYVEMLEKHKYNLEKFLQFDDYPKVNKELINSRTTVSQLKFELLELDALRHQIYPADVQIFDQKIRATKENARLSIDSFVEFTKSSKLHNNLTRSVFLEKAAVNSNDRIVDKLNSPPSETMLLLSKSYDDQNLVEILSQNDIYCQKLQNDLIEINQIFGDLSNLVHQQGDTITTVENNVESATNETEEGVKNLYQAMKYKKALYPLAGAVIGGCIAGPVGLVCGLKIGGVAALSGAIIGMQGGRWFKKIHNNDKGCTVPIFNKIFNKKSNESEPSIDTKKEE